MLGRVWFEQQQAVRESDEARAVAVNNDKDGFLIFLEKYATEAIIDRHEATAPCSTRSSRSPA